MNLKPGSWVWVKGWSEPGRVTQIIGKYFRADFLKEDGVEYCLDLIPATDIKKIITDKKEVELLEKEHKGELELIG